MKRERPTAKSVVSRILLSKRVPTDEEIIRRVREKSGSKKFDRAQLAFYKNRARNGKLPGQDGTRYVIQQERAKVYKF
jgi:hypothetical protein